MANTYTQLIIHGVFAVKYRESMISKAWQEELFSYLGGALNGMGHRNLLVNGVADHVHILFGMKPTLALSDTMRDVKANASKWLNESGKLKHRFEWQDGYGGFSISKTHLDAVFKYIKTQEQHHEKVSFRDEYMKLLKKNDVVFDEKWIFNDVL